MRLRLLCFASDPGDAPAETLEETMRTVTSGVAISLAVCLGAVSGSAQQDTHVAKIVQTVRLSNFAFDPEHLRLKANVPVVLRLVSDGGRHDFSAPAFFSSSGFLPGSSAPPDGDIAVGSDETVEVGLIPEKTGVYPLKCTHFLHSLFGMHGTIEVVP
jgi:plastocyanin